MIAIRGRFAATHHTTGPRRSQTLPGTSKSRLAPLTLDPGVSYVLTVIRGGKTRVGQRADRGRSGRLTASAAGRSVLAQFRFAVAKVIGN